jgi:hypothetical protein
LFQRYHNICSYLNSVYQAEKPGPLCNSNDINLAQYGFGFGFSLDSYTTNERTLILPASMSKSKQSLELPVTSTYLNILAPTFVDSLSCFVQCGITHDLCMSNELDESDRNLVTNSVSFYFIDASLDIRMDNKNSVANMPELLNAYVDSNIIMGRLQQIFNERYAKNAL